MFQKFTGLIKAKLQKYKINFMIWLRHIQKFLLQWKSKMKIHAKNNFFFEISCIQRLTTKLSHYQEISHVLSTIFKNWQNSVSIIFVERNSSIQHVNILKIKFAVKFMFELKLRFIMLKSLIVLAIYSIFINIRLDILSSKSAMKNFHFNLLKMFFLHFWNECVN